MPQETLNPGDDFVVPSDVDEVTFVLRGGSGTGRGAGGYVEGDRAVSEGETYHVRSTSGGNGPGWARDGASAVDIRFGGTSLEDRIAVAGGGGGDGDDRGVGGDAGFPEGDDGDSSASATTSSGEGGTQTEGGAGGSGSLGGTSGEDGDFGTGGDGGTGDTASAGGGGAGWYGGGGGDGSDNTNITNGGGGGGGSSNADGLTDVSYGNASGTNVEVFYEVIPEPVTGLAVDHEYLNEVALSWEPSEEADEYIINRDGTEVAAVTDTSYTDTGLPADGSFTYAVVASNDAGDSDPRTVDAVTGGAPPTLETSNLTGDSVDVALGEPAADFTEVRLYRDGSEVQSGQPGTFNETSLVNGREYEYTCTSVYPDAESVFGPSETVVTDLPTTDFDEVTES